jgi:hypothetical protein
MLDLCSRSNCIDRLHTLPEEESRYSFRNTVLFFFQDETMDKIRVDTESDSNTLSSELYTKFYVFNTPKVCSCVHNGLPLDTIPQSISLTFISTYRIPLSLLTWRIILFGLFPFRTKTEIMILRSSWCWSRWPRGLRHEPSSPARTLGSWARIPFKAWMFVCVYSVFVLFCV